MDIYCNLLVFEKDWKCSSLCCLHLSDAVLHRQAGVDRADGRQSSRRVGYRVEKHLQACTSMPAQSSRQWSVFHGFLIAMHWCTIAEIVAKLVAALFMTRYGITAEATI